jgi:type I restriction enzyme S subunit
MSWFFVALGDYCKIISGSTPDTNVSEYWSGNICWATPKDLSELSSAYIHTTPRKITKAGFDSCSATMLPPGSVLFSSRAPIGHVAINTVEMCTNQGFKSFVPDPKYIFNKFLYYWLKANKQRLENMGNGATFKEISKATISKVEIPLPPLEEQKRIAAILDKADALRQKQQHAIAKLDTLLQSVFLDMFGDPVTNPKGWNVVELRELLSFLTSGSRGWAAFYSDSGSIFLRIQNIGKNRLLLNDITYVNAPDNVEAKRIKVKTGDVLLSVTADLGRCAVIPENLDDAYINQHLALLRVKNINPLFLSAFITSPGGQRQIESLNREGVKAGLNFDNIRSLKILSPPLELQERYVTSFSKMEVLRSRLKRALDKSNDLFRSLQQRAFNGELFSASIESAEAATMAMAQQELFE